MKFRLFALMISASALAWGQKPTPPAKPAKPVHPPAAPAKPVPPAPADAPAEPPAKGKVPDIEAAIPASVKALGEPAMVDFPGGIRMAVTTASDKAQAHVNQGLNHLHGGWEFEASRHFAVALREDPDCLMAHWGMIMSVLSPSPETFAVRAAATTRFYLLVAAGSGTALERGYAEGLMKYIEAGPAAAGEAFSKVASEFPNDLQAGIFAALFSRTGYDELATATFGQENAEKNLQAMAAKFPDSPLPLNALLIIRAEAPDLRPSVEQARKLVALAPDYPPYQHVLGHYAWRSGHHAEAIAAFARASAGFQSWMKADKVSTGDCPEWIKAECYRVVAMVSKGDLDGAYAAARAVAAIPLPKNRLSSPGGRVLLWDAKTLPARVLLHRGLRGNANEALHSLPAPADIINTHDASLAYWWIDGLRFALEARRLLDDGKTNDAALTIAVFTRHGEQMAKTQAAAGIGGEKSSWTRGFRAVEVLASELRGNLAMSSPANRRGPAFNWYSSAADRQQTAPSMFPPLLLTPMGIHLGEYYLDAKKPDEAVTAYQQTLARYPNDLKVLEGLKLALEKAGKPAEAAETAKQIDALKAP